jgi:hypothetical protein
VAGWYSWEKIVQCSLVYPTTYDPARSGRINARTGLANTTQMLVHWFDPISFGPVQRENRINEDRIKETILYWHSLDMQSSKDCGCLTTILIVAEPQRVCPVASRSTVLEPWC